LATPALSRAVNALIRLDQGKNAMPLRKLVSFAVCLAGVANAQLITGWGEDPTIAPEPEPVYLVDVGTDTATPLFDGVQVWGLAADDAGRNLYVASEGDLYQVPYDTLVPELVAQIGGSPSVSMVGLAWNPNTGTLFGTRASSIVAEEALYEIDPVSGAITLALDFDNGFDFGGLEYNPGTGLFYGLNDSGTFTRGLYSLNPGTGQVLLVKEHPAGETDLDGLAIGNGRAYMTQDESGEIFVLNLTTLAYEDPLTSPYVEGGTFAGAAWSATIPEPGTAALLVLAGLALTRRARRD
jgi:hypothetical protein